MAKPRLDEFAIAAHIGYSRGYLRGMLARARAYKRLDPDELETFRLGLETLLNRLDEINKLVFGDENESDS